MLYGTSPTTKSVSFRDMIFFGFLIQMHNFRSGFPGQNRPTETTDRHMYLLTSGVKMGRLQNEEIGKRKNSKTLNKTWLFLDQLASFCSTETRRRESTLALRTDGPQKYREEAEISSANYRFRGSKVVRVLRFQPEHAKKNAATLVTKRHKELPVSTRIRLWNSTL